MCMRMITCLVTIVFVMAGALGCASYAVPGRGAEFSSFGLTADQRDGLTDASVVQAMSKQPLATFPANVAVVRVQASGYSSRTAQGYGGGAYSVITTRDVEKTDQIQRLGALPMVRGIVALNRLVLPWTLQSDLELRQAAAQLHADLLLIYTIDTTFTVEDKLAPLTVVTLGLSPNQQARINTTASALLLDTRTGYIYGVAEASEKDNRLTSAWTSSDAVDGSRRFAEEKVFAKLVDEVATMWSGVVRQYSQLPIQAN